MALRRRHGAARFGQELARSAVGPQAWRIGRSFCTQFHPEATETMIRRWALSEGGSAELLKHGIKPDELIDDTRRNVADSQPAADHLVDWFLDRVAGDEIRSREPVERHDRVELASSADRGPSPPCRAPPGGSYLRSNFEPSRCSRPISALQPDPLSELVRDGLAGHAEVAIDLGGEELLRVAGALEQERQSQLGPPLLARMEPFVAGDSQLAVQSDVDDHPRRSQRLAGEPPSS